jgi:hypothetical protein
MLGELHIVLKVLMGRSMVLTVLQATVQMVPAPML